MKTMKKLCNKFNRMFPNYFSALDEFNSTLGYYRVVIMDTNDFRCYPHYFKSTRDFNSWIKGVVID